MRGQTTSTKKEDLLRQSQMELQWIQRRLAMIGARNLHHQHLPHIKGKTKNEVSSQQAAGVYNVNRFRVLEEKNRALKHEVVTLRQEKQHYKKLKAKLHAALQEKNRLNLELINQQVRESKHEQVRCDYVQLRQRFATVSWERDVAQRERSQLQAKVKNLEHVLKHIHEALQLKQQLQTEYEQALVAVYTKQKEINQLQKSWDQTDQQHEEAVQLLEVKLCDLEQKCRSHSEQFHQLSKRLPNVHLQSEPAEFPNSYSTLGSQSPASSEEKLSQAIAESEAQLQKGDESAPNAQLLIPQFSPCPLQTEDSEAFKLLSVKSSTITTDRSSSPDSIPIRDGG